MTTLCLETTSWLPSATTWTRAPSGGHRHTEHTDNDRCTACIDRMLELTRPTYVWQRPLLEMLQACIMEADVRQTLTFLEHTVTEARRLTSQHLPNQGVTNIRSAVVDSGPVFLYLDTSLAPRTMDVENWKKLLIALGFEIEEPDGRRSIDDVSVCLSPGVMSEGLDGMALLLRLIGGVPWNILRMVFKLGDDDVEHFRRLVLQRGEVDSADQTVARRLCGSYPDEMKDLGFQQKRREISRSCQNCEQTSEILGLVIHALYPHTSSQSDVYV
ncbi:uncharacterized protein LOC101859674 [Aplysia californica]|uniref:Uncharacterized protein LOC101859674 n=1 Tax=Aplysia californica TaxID=6500 RepID=A0ABM1ABN3_APLCA|nr:uncharacterized protein LOC101859674 [Aplysia californica]